MKLLQHPQRFKDGVRVVQLLSRNKDAAQRRRPDLRVSNSANQFDSILEELAAKAVEGQRIYASAEPRDVHKAIRSFKQRQLDNDYDPDPTKFYRSIQTSWIKALMRKENSVREERIWLIDCDTFEDIDLAQEELRKHYDPMLGMYDYPSKSGHHMLIKPFDYTKASDEFGKLLHKNPLMLWGH